MTGQGLDVAVVGGGLVGPLVACLLARRGGQVCVFEKRVPGQSATGHSRNANLSLSPRGMRALAAIGVADEVRAAGVTMDSRAMHLPNGSVRQAPYGRPEWVNVSIGRDALCEILSVAARSAGVEFRYGMRCLDVDVEQRRVLFEGPAGIEAVAARVVLGADGAHSRVRAALIARPGVDYEQVHFRGGYREIHIPRGRDGYVFDPRAIHLWPREDRFLVGLPNADGSFALNYVYPDHGPHAFDAALGVDELAPRIAADFPDLPDPESAAQQICSNPPARLVTVRCSRYHHEQSVAILGDAAHAILPFIGQGVNLGFEDCTALIQLVEQHGDLGRALADFSVARRCNANSAADLSEWNYRELAGGVLMPKAPAQADEIPPVVKVNFMDVPYTAVVEGLERPTPPHAATTPRLENSGVST